MSQTLDAIFDGEVLRPDEPIELEPNTRVRITIEPAQETESKSKSFLDAVWGRRMKRSWSLRKQTAELLMIDSLCRPLARAWESS